MKKLLYVGSVGLLACLAIALRHDSGGFAYGQTDGKRTPSGKAGLAGSNDLIPAQTAATKRFMEMSEKERKEAMLSGFAPRNEFSLSILIGAFSVGVHERMRQEQEARARIAFRIVKPNAGLDETAFDFKEKPEATKMPELTETERALLKTLQGLDEMEFEQFLKNIESQIRDIRKLHPDGKDKK